MKKLIFSLLIINPCFVFAQFGIKAGLNFANVSKAASINNSSRFGNVCKVESSFNSELCKHKTWIYNKQGDD